MGTPTINLVILQKKKNIYVLGKNGNILEYFKLILKPNDIIF